MSKEWERISKVSQAIRQKIHFNCNCNGCEENRAHLITLIDIDNILEGYEAKENK